MIHLFLDNRPWFRPKRSGFGTGLPIAWQGWALLALHVALIVGVTVLLGERPLLMTIGVITVGLAPMPIYRARTEGGWRWR